MSSFSHDDHITPRRLPEPERRPRWRADVPYREPTAEERADFAQKRAAFLAHFAAATQSAEPPQPPAPIPVEAAPPLPSTLPEPAAPEAAAPPAPAEAAGLPAQPEAANPTAKPRRKPSEQVTLFGETWEVFTTGILPLSLLKDMAMALEDSAAFRLQEDVTHDFLWSEDSARMWHFSRTARHDARALLLLEEHDLTLLMGQEMERLIRTQLLPKHAEHELRRDAIFGMLKRLGQLYRHSLKRWGKGRAREVFWGQVQVVCLYAKRVSRVIEQGKQVQARRQAWEAEQREAARQALAVVGDYAI
jgi:hypothetical protein